MLFQTLNSLFIATFQDLFSITIVAAITACIYLGIFSTLYYLPVGLSLKFPYKKIVHLVLILVGVIMVEMLIRGSIVMPHLSPIILTNNTFPDFAFHVKRLTSDLFYPQFALSLPFHKLDEIEPILVNIIMFVIIGSYARFKLKLNSKQYYYFVIGSLLIASILNYRSEFVLNYFAYILLNAIIAFVIHEFSKTVKINAIVILVTIVLSTALLGVLTENKYASEQRIKKAELLQFTKIITDDPLKTKWNRFINQEGMYSVLYPSEILYEENKWTGGKSQYLSDFHIREEWQKDNRKVTLIIWGNLDPSGNTPRPTSIRLYNGNGSHEVQLTYRKITRNNITAEQYSRVSESNSDGENMKIETYFSIENKHFRAELDYPKSIPIWEHIYNDMWSSIKLETK